MTVPMNAIKPMIPTVIKNEVIVITLPPNFINVLISLLDKSQIQRTEEQLTDQ